MEGYYDNGLAKTMGQSTGSFIDQNGQQVPFLSNDVFNAYGGNNNSPYGFTPKPMNNWQKGSLAMQGITSFLGAIDARKQTKMMKQNNRFEQGLANRNLHNSAVTTNRQLSDRNDVAAQLTSGAEYGSAGHLAERDRGLISVDGSPITV